MNRMRIKYTFVAIQVFCLPSMSRVYTWSSLLLSEAEDCGDAYNGKITNRSVAHREQAIALLVEYSVCWESVADFERRRLI